MSNLLSQQDIHETYEPKHCDAIELIIESREKDLGGLSVRRLLPVNKKRMVGPWIFFDHMGPAQFKPGQGVDVRPHPHIHLATVTYLFEGEILHRDSLGSYQVITPGDVNLMVAGRGITHSERERPEIRNTQHTLHGVQLWLALPESLEDSQPAFYHFTKQAIPQIEVEGVPIRVIMGQAYGVQSPVTTLSPTLFLEAYLQPQQSMVLPPAQERAVYIAHGEMKALETRLAEHSMTVFAPHNAVQLIATQPTRMVLVGGESLGPRYMEWNFVSSSQEAIERAKKDWVSGHFPKVVGDADEYIPLP